jgi:hypothetical protein
VSKGFYLGAVLGGLVLGAILTGVGAMVASTGFTNLMKTGEQPTLEELRAAIAPGLPFMAIGGLLGILGAAAWLILVYKMWAAVRGPGVWPSPGLAAGLLLVPLVNVVWMFIVWGRWPGVFNGVGRQRGTKGPKMPEWLGWAVCILGFVPCLGIANLVLMPLYVAKACDGINALAAE